MTMKKLTTICVVMLVGVASVWAKPALKRPVNMVQPDGTTVTLMLHGDEYRSFTTTVDGYTADTTAMPSGQPRDGWRQQAT